MEKTIHAFILLLLMTTASFTARPVFKPRLFPRLEHYFQSLRSGLIDTGRIAPLHKLKATIAISAKSAAKVVILITCPDNSFRSQEAQIILQSLAWANHIDKLQVLSAGYETGKLNPRLVKMLSEIGYRVSPVPGGQHEAEAFALQWSDQFPPLTIFSKKIDDQSIPRSIFQLIKTCSKEEGKCADVAGALFTAEQPYKNPADIEDEQELEKEFNTMAAELYFTFREACLQEGPSQER